MLIVVSADELIADGFQIVDKHGFLVAVGDRLVDILPQDIPVGRLTAFLDPILLFAGAVDRRFGQYAFAEITADAIGYVPQLHMITDLVAILFAVHKRGGIDHEMVVQLTRIQMGRDDHLMPVSPHLPCGAYTDLVRLFRSDLTGTEALVAVISNHLATLAETPLDRRHFFIGSELGTVDTTDIHRLVGFIRVLCVFQRCVEIVIKVFTLDGFVGISRVVDDLLQPVFDRPESGGSHVASHSAHIICR